MIEIDCVKGELMYDFEVGDTEDPWVCYVKSKKPIEEMKRLLSLTLTGHHGLRYQTLFTLEDPKGNVLKIRIAS